MPVQSAKSSYLALTPAIVLLLCLVMFSQTVQAQWQSFTLSNGNIVIDIEIDGHAARAILDSGASSHMISSTFVKKYGQDFTKLERIKVKGVYGKKKLQLYSNIPVNLFGTDVQLDKVLEGLGNGADLLLGGAFFQGAIIQIDYPNSRLRRLSQKSVDLKKHANVPMKRARGGRFPAIQVEHNGAKVWLIFDTGNSGGVLVERGFAIDNDWLNDKTDVTELTSFGLFESSTSQNFFLDSFKIGPYELEHVSVIVPGEDHINDFGHYMNELATGTKIVRGVKAKGLIGYDILKHFIVTIDYMKYRVNLYAP